MARFAKALARRAEWTPGRWREIRRRQGYSFTSVLGKKLRWEKRLSVKQELRGIRHAEFISASVSRRILKQVQDDEKCVSPKIISFKLVVSSLILVSKKQVRTRQGNPCQTHFSLVKNQERRKTRWKTLLQSKVNGVWEAVLDVQDHLNVGDLDEAWPAWARAVEECDEAARMLEAKNFRSQLMAIRDKLSAIQKHIELQHVPLAIEAAKSACEKCSLLYTELQAAASEKPSRPATPARHPIIITEEDLRRYGLR